MAREAELTERLISGIALLQIQLVVRVRIWIPIPANTGTTPPCRLNPKLTFAVLCI